MQDGVVVTQGAGDPRTAGPQSSFFSSNASLTCKRGRLEAVRDAANELNGCNTAIFRTPCGNRGPEGAGKNAVVVLEVIPRLFVKVVGPDSCLFW
jgi:hypothetical protein